MGRPNWKNQTIWTGDNLDIMRGMNSASVDLIYLDPPFNSNANYAAPIGSKAAGAAFKDTWGLDDINLAWHGEIKHDYPGLYALLTATREIQGDSMMSYLIYMAIRIMEMKRILKVTGSIYLHCDPIAGPYLKLLMDSTFGTKNFRNIIACRRNESGAKGNQHAPKSWGSNVNFLLFYSNGRQATFDPRTNDLDEEEIRQKFPKTDGNGKRYNTKTTAWRSPSMGERPNLFYSFRGIYPPYPSGWRLKPRRMEEEFAKGNVVVVDGKLERRSYEKDYKGVSPGNLWADTELLLGAQSDERTGYPTQKPVALLRRIIRASSNSGDVVLDPFCGCATACIAAQIEGRQWIGMDISDKAAELVQDRMVREVGLFFQGVHRTDIPKRTDLGKVIPYNDVKNKQYLYGEQGGFCNGCEHHFMMQNLTVDHIIAKAHGGTDHISNLQLLCSSCNSLKGTKSHEELIVLLTDKGWIKRKKAA